MHTTIKMIIRVIQTLCYVVEISPYYVVIATIIMLAGSVMIEPP